MLLPSTGMDQLRKALDEAMAARTGALYTLAPFPRKQEHQPNNSFTAQMRLSDDGL